LNEQRPAVTVVLPVRDEASTVGLVLDSLARQSLGPERLEVLVYDGLSSDETKQVCEGYAHEHSWKRFEVIDNSDRTVPSALNRALAASTCLWFMRLDGRTWISPSYVEACVARAAAEGKVAAGGRLAAQATGAVASAIAAVVTHPIGIGRGFRNAADPGTDLPHHPFAVWRTQDLRSLGGFDPALTRNQDDELSMRAAKQGWRIALVPDAEVMYRPRERIRGLAAQYFQYGLWKSVVARRHGLFPRRSLVPAAVAAAWIGALSLRATRRSVLPLRSIVAVYLTAGFLVARERPSTNPVLTAWALAVLHASYGVGVMAGFVKPRLAQTRIGKGRIR
jgi:succinoglycan biosynthesis protein ExoA